MQTAHWGDVPAVKLLRSLQAGPSENPNKDKDLKTTYLAALLGALFCSAASAAPLTSGIDTSGADPAIRPQDDLFLATNGGWIKKTEIPADKSRFGTFVQLRDLSDERVKGIVEELAKATHAKGTVEQKIGDYFKSYIDTDAIDRAGTAPVESLLRELAAIKDRKQLMALMGRWEGVIDSPIQLQSQADFRNPGVYSATTWQGGLGMPDRDYYLKDDDARLMKARAAYQTYIEALLRLSGDAKPEVGAQVVYALERQLAEAQWSKVDNRDPKKVYNPATIKELEKTAPQLRWRAFLSEAAFPVSTDWISLAQPSYVHTVAKLLDDVPLDTWKLYMKVRVLDAAADMLPAPWREVRFAYHGKAVQGLQKDRARWQKGVDQLNGALGEAVGQVYVARYFPPAYKARMEELVGNLMKAYAQSIDGLAWMGPETKAQARVKLSKYVTKIGYPDVWRDYSRLEIRTGDPLGNAIRASRFEHERQVSRNGQKVDRAEWGMTPQTVNAYYNPSYNEIVFPAAILQPPFFNMEAEDAANYGGIGAVIGHEISHGFDDQGSQFDGDGKLRNWWSESDRKAFDALGAKLVAQYDGYEPLPGKRINGQLTLGENIADLSGLQIAYKAYALSLEGKPSPVIDGMAGEQRFFLGWSQVWRGKSREERAAQLLTIDPHSPEMYRANGAAVNHDGFHQAFGTKAGDGMFKPEGERIRMW